MKENYRSRMAIFINLMKHFTEGLSNLISSLPSRYSLEEGEYKFWNYTFIIFKVRDPQFVEREIRDNLENDGINNIFRKVGKRHTWVSVDNQNLEGAPVCLERVVKTCLQVKEVAEGRNYMDRAVILEMERFIEQIILKNRTQSKHVLDTGMEIAGTVGPVAAGALGGAQWRLEQRELSADQSVLRAGCFGSFR